MDLFSSDLSVLVERFRVQADEVERAVAAKPWQPPPEVSSQAENLCRARAFLEEGQQANDVRSTLPDLFKRLLRPQHRVNARLLRGAMELLRTQEIAQKQRQTDVQWMEERVGSLRAQADRVQTNLDRVQLSLQRAQSRGAQSEDRQAGAETKVEERLARLEAYAEAQAEILPRVDRLAAGLTALEVLCQRLVTEEMRDLRGGLSRAEMVGAKAEESAHRTQESLDAVLAQLVRRTLHVATADGGLGQSAYLGDNRVLTQTAWGALLLLDARDTEITPAILRAGTWDPRLTDLVRRRVHPGMAVFEAGAHVGYFTILSCFQAGTAGHVFAYEPNPNTARLLRDNVRMNHAGHVCEVRELALGAASGRASLRTFEHNMGSSSLGDYPPRLLAEMLEEPSRAEVDVDTLDRQAFPPGLQFGFLKFDIEGAEVSALRGGDRFFAERVAPGAVMALECNPPALQGQGATPEDLLALLRHYGFHVHRFTSEGALELVGEKLDSWCNTELYLERPAA